MVCSQWFFGGLEKVAAAAEEGDGAHSEDGQRGGFGGWDAGGEAVGGDVAAEVIDDVGEVGEVDGGRAVEVAAGPRGGGARRSC